MLVLFQVVGCTLLAPPEISVSGVSPEWGYLGERTEIRVSGQRFYPSVMVDGALDDGGRVQGTFEVWLETEPPTALGEVQLVDYDLLTAEVPAGLEAGVYDLRVRAPSGREDTLADAFTVTETRADHLAISVADAGWTVGDYVPVVVRLADPEGDAVAQAMEVEFVATSETGAASVVMVEGGLDGQVALDGEVGVRGTLEADGEGIVLVTSTSPDDVTITVSPVGDPLVDPDSVLLSWDPGSIADVAIDLPRSDFRVEAGETFTVDLTLRDDLGNTLDDETARVVLLDECTDWWSSVTVNGTATVDVTLTTACGADHLRAVTTEGQWTSDAFEVLPSVATGYTLEPTPTRVTAGAASLLLLVRGVDAYGNVVDDLDAQIDLRDDAGGLDAARAVGAQTCPGFPEGEPAQQVCTVALWTAGDAIVVTATDQIGRTGDAEPVEVVADTASELLVTTAAAQVVAGEPFDILVRLLDAWGNDVTLDPAGPAAPVFEDDTGSLECAWASSSAGGQVYTCVLEVATAETMIRVLSGTLDGGVADPLEVVNAGLAEVEVDAPGSPFTAGTPFDVVLRGYDAFGNAYLVQSDPDVDLSDTTGTLAPSTGRLGSTGEATVAVTITMASQGIRIAAGQASGTLGTSVPFTVQAGAHASFAVVAPPWIALDEEAEVVVTAIDAWGNPVPDYAGPVTISATGGSCGEATLESFSEGEGVARVTCSDAALSEVLEADDADGITGVSDWVDVLDFACADGPTADLLLDGAEETVACTSGGVAVVDADASGSAAGGNGLVLVHFADSEGTTERSTATSTTFSWSTGIHAVEAVVADRIGCAAVAEAVAYIGDDDGDATGPILVEASSSSVVTGGSVTVTVEAEDCKGDVADLATLVVRADLGTPAATATGEGLELALDASGQASFAWTFGEGFAATGTLHVGAADGGAYGATEVTTTQDTVRPHLLSASASGTTSGVVDEIVVVFDEAMYEANLNGAITLSGPGGSVDMSMSVSSDGETLTITPLSTVDASVGMWTLTVSSNVRDRAGNRLDGAWTGAANSSVVTFGVVADDGLVVTACPSDLSRFSPDGDDAAGEEADSVILTPSVSAAATWWVWAVEDEAGDTVRTVWTAGGTSTLSWDGRDDDGLVVGDGPYTLLTRAMDAQGNLSEPCETLVNVTHDLEAP